MPANSETLKIWKGLTLETLGSFRFDLRSEGVRTGEPSPPPKRRYVKSRDIRVRAELLLCALIDNLRFMYDITEDDFSAVMEPAAPSLYERAIVGVSRLLRLHEQDEVLEIASAVSDAWIRVSNNHQSLITMQDRAYIIANVVEPARHLRIDPRYMIEQLHDLNIHQWHSTHLKDTFLFTNTTSRWGRALGFLSSGRKQTLLAKRLVSDDITISNLNAKIGDHLRTMLGSAIAEFDKQRCGNNMGSIEREIYVNRVAARLAREVEHWEAMARRERNTRAYSTMPLQARIHRSQENIPPVPSVPNYLPQAQADVLSMGSKLTDLREEADNQALGVRGDDEDPQSLLVEYRPDIQAPTLPYPSRSQSLQNLSSRGTPGLQRSASMRIGAASGAVRNWQYGVRK